MVQYFLMMLGNRRSHSSLCDHEGKQPIHIQTFCIHATIWFFTFSMLLLLLSCSSRVGLCATLQTSAHQAPSSLKFSSQEHWSGFPFLSPMHESEKWKWKWSRVQVLATPWTAAYQAPPSMGFSRQEYWSGVPLPSPQCYFTIQNLPWLWVSLTINRRLGRRRQCK